MDWDWNQRLDSEKRWYEYAHWYEELMAFQPLYALMVSFFSNRVSDDVWSCTRNYLLPMLIYHKIVAKLNVYLRYVIDTIFIVVYFACFETEPDQTFPRFAVIALGLIILNSNLVRVGNYINKHLLFPPNPFYYGETLHGKM